MQIIFSKIYKSMPSYLLKEVNEKGVKCGFHISDKSGVTVVDFVQTYNNDSSPITFDASKIPTKEAIESGIVAFEKIYNAQVSRRAEYLPITDQLDMQYKDLLNGTTTWKDHVAKVKSDNPKE
jgi:hypothetical protein